MKDWVFGTPDGEWVSMVVLSDGSYGVEQDLMFSFPVIVKEGKVRIVQGLELDEFSQEHLTLSEAELKEEKDSVKQLFAV